MPELCDPQERRVLTIPNALSVARLCLLPFIYGLLRQETRQADLVAAALMAAGAATDFLDGVLARLLRQTSNVGRILDPLADKIFAIFILLVLVGLGRLPSWYAAAVVARDLIIVLGGAYLVLGKRFVSESNRAGKWAAFSIVVVILVHTLRIQSMAAPVRWLSLLLLLTSVVSYATVFARILQRRTLVSANAVADQAMKREA
ncbi:MAG: CDP-alcohol phosphatidyltransferase family protein [candidate division KSB1 bacterium]|nr:CDP-alcohol phosphatidyltransferase family protein [candidate division KSB1 bacterium]MDZ7391579.1 CDP-alcohol phosphatidyltransferase family protein [candidate division KSB1 bacterium]